MQSLEKTSIVLVENHVIIRKAMSELINSFEGYEVIWDVSNGKEVVDIISVNNKPKMVLLDIAMPIMDGYQTASWLKQHYPEIKVLAFSMLGDEKSIIKMLRSGAKGYILKDVEPKELQVAFDELMRNGFYIHRAVGEILSNGAMNPLDENGPPYLTANELKFLKLTASDDTYAQIAERMFLSPRTIDGYRDSLFEKFEVKSRVGLVLQGIKYGLIEL